jgi:hypothetical protein
MDLSKEHDPSSGAVSYKCYCGASEPRELHQQNRVQRLQEAYFTFLDRRNFNATFTETVAFINMLQAYRACVQCRVDFITATDSRITVWRCIDYAIVGEYEERLILKDMELSNLIAQKRQQKQHNTTRREKSKLEEERICRKRMLKYLRRTLGGCASKYYRAKYSGRDDYVLVDSILDEHTAHNNKKQQELKEIISQVITQQDNSNFIKIIEMEMKTRADILENLKITFLHPVCIIL